MVILEHLKEVVIQVSRNPNLSISNIHYDPYIFGSANNFHVYLPPLFKADDIGKVDFTTGTVLFVQRVGIGMTGTITVSNVPTGAWDKTGQPVDYENFAIQFRDRLLAVLKENNLIKTAINV